MASDLMFLYAEMLKIRLIEETMATRYADQEMRCPVHLSVGQEAVAVGACQALEQGDKLFSTHRCHAHYIAKGGDLDAMLGEIYGKETGCCGGRGGSMHLFDSEAGLEMSVPIVGSSLPLTVGAALAFRQQGRDRVAMTIIGDAATEEGTFHESLNFAKLHHLPVVFICENNLYSIYTNLRDRQPARPIADLALAHGVPSFTGDGNDVQAVLNMTRAAVDNARAGKGPTFLVFETYRWREHCGPNYDNHIGYRTEEEFQQWKAVCPLARTRARLLADGTLTEVADEALNARLKADIDAAFERARQAPLPRLETVSHHVYAD
jgi:pyruvate dehydrogenase E1 component alpha subunit